MRFLMLYFSQKVLVEKLLLILLQITILELEYTNYVLERIYRMIVIIY